MKTEPIIRIFHINKRYDTKNVLQDISLNINKNEFLFVSGPSGAGKTTLLKMLYRGEEVSSGQIIVDGINLKRIKKRRIHLLRRKFGIIFQNYKLITSRNVFENIALVIEAVAKTNFKSRTDNRRLVSKKVNSVLRTVGMENRGKAMPLSLSGGEQQRIAVARALAVDPIIIVADEPTASLDTESAGIIFNLLKKVHTLGTTVIIATHDTALIRKSGGRVILLDQGQLQTSTIIPQMAK